MVEVTHSTLVLVRASTRVGARTTIPGGKNVLEGLGTTGWAEGAPGVVIGNQDGLLHCQ